MRRLEIPPVKASITVAAVLLLGFAFANFQTVLFATAVVSAEGRPALLSDAGWDDPASAQRFRTRFRPGVPEADLIGWLEANGFAVAFAERRAERRIHGLACGETVHVRWAADPRTRLTAAEARVREAGCL